MREMANHYAIDVSKTSKTSPLLQKTADQQYPVPVNSKGQIQKPKPSPQMQAAVDYIKACPSAFLSDVATILPGVVGASSSNELSAYNNYMFFCESLNIRPLPAVVSKLAPWVASLVIAGATKNSAQNTANALMRALQKIGALAITEIEHAALTNIHTADPERITDPIYPSEFKDYATPLKYLLAVAFVFMTRIGELSASTSASFKRTGVFWSWMPTYNLKDTKSRASRGSVTFRCCCENNPDVSARAEIPARWICPCNTLSKLSDYHFSSYDYYVKELNDENSNERNERLKSHAARIGCACYLRHMGYSIEYIKCQGRWQDQTMVAYYTCNPRAILPTEWDMQNLPSWGISQSGNLL
jgi:hypothetical protein